MLAQLVSYVDTAGENNFRENSLMRGKKKERLESGRKVKKGENQGRKRKEKEKEQVEEKEQEVEKGMYKEKEGRDRHGQRRREIQSS